MYCKRCGRELKDKAKFCPRCGTAILRPRKKKKTGKIVALTLSGLILLGACSGVFVYRDTLMAWLEGDRVYTEADEIIRDAIVCESFQQADFEGRKEIAEKTLKQMEADKKIQSKSVSYSDDGYYYFHFKNGADGIISLLDQNKTLDGASPFYSEDNQSKTYKVGDIDRIPDFSEKNIKQPYEENDKTALIIDQLEYEFNSKNFEEDSKEWSKCHLKTTYKSDVTAGKMKTLLHGYDFIDIRCHGQMDTSINKNFATPAIVLNEKFENPAKKGYLLDLKEGRIAALYSWDAGQYILNPKFFTYYYQFKKLDNPIVWIGCCNGLKNDKLVKVFSKIGASAVVGATESVNTLYGTEMCDEFVYQLMLGKDTVIALNKAKEVWGENDGGSPPAEFKIYNDGSAEIITLFTLTDSAKKLISGDVSEGAISGKVVDVDGNTVVGATVIIESSSNDTSVETNQQGEFQVSCSPGDYTINVIADGYETYTSPDTIEVKSEGVTYADQIKLMPKATVPAIVQAVLDGEAQWQDDPNNYLQNVHETTAEQVCGWFQDLNMDGEPEYIVGPLVGGAHAAHDFYIWTEEDGKLKAYNLGAESSSDGGLSNIYTLWPMQSGAGSAAFTGQLFQNTKTKEFLYTFFNEDGVSSEGWQIVDTMQCAEKTIFGGRFSVTTEYANNNITGYRYTANGEENIPAQQFKDAYEAYFADLQPFAVTTKNISYQDYQAADAEGRKALLLDSYNAWSYQETSDVTLPLSDEIARISQTANTTKSETEANLQEKVNGLNVIEWNCGDFDQDGNLEAFCLVGTTSKIEELVFVNQEPGYTVLRSSFWGACGSGKVVECNGTKYYILDTNNGGSGSGTYVFYSLQNNGREASFSGLCHLFGVDENGAPYTFGSGSDAHEKPRIYLNADPTTKDLSMS